MDPTESHPPAPPPDPPFPGLESTRRPRGKIARLPSQVRKTLNEFLDEGLTYLQVIAKLGGAGAALTEVDISRWFKTGHQDWIKNQAWLEQTRSRLDLASDVVAEHEGSDVHLANLHVAATHLIQDLVARGEKLLEEHPDQYVDVINAVTRLSREALQFQRYREACTLARAELAKLKDPDRKLSETETLAIVDRLDHILGFK